MISLSILLGALPIGDPVSAMPLPQSLSEDKLYRYDRVHDYTAQQYIITIKRAIAANEDPSRVGLYIRALSRLKAKAAIPLLIDNITYSTHRSGPGGLPSTEHDYPCIFALIQIGTPALEPLLKRAATNDSRPVEAAIATVLYRSLDAEYSAAIIGVHIKREKDAAKLKRLQSLMQEIERKASPRTDRPRKPRNGM